MLRSLSPTLAQVSTRTLGRALRWAAPVAAGSLLLALSARVAVPLPFSPVPITGQTLAVLALAGLLGRRSAGSVALYLGAGAAGLPVFAARGAGLAGPTGGYLLGFVAAAWLGGWLTERSGRSCLRLALALVLAQAAIYACGLLWLSRFVPASRLLVAGLYPFLIGDAYKLVAAFFLVWRLRPRG